MGMANIYKYIECSNCRHPMSEHKQIDFGPQVCTVDRCDCRTGPAQRDDLVDIILDQKEFLNELIARVDLTNETHGLIHSFLCSLDKRLEDLK